MPRRQDSLVENSFFRGLITDTTGVNDIPNSVKDTKNCKFNRDGSVERRKGFDYEGGYNTVEVDFEFGNRNYTVSKFVWRNAGGQENNNILVIQLGANISFFQMNENEPISASFLSTESLEDFATPFGSGKTGTIYCDYAASAGNLYIASKYCDPFIVTFEDGAVVWDTSNKIEIKIRDFEGLEDGLEVNERPTTLSTEHKYNLYNQGWYFPTDGRSTANRNQVVLEIWDALRSDYPSNSDVWWTGKDANELFDERLAARTYAGNTSAPKGHYILNAFYQDRSDVSGVNNIPVVSTEYRPAVIAFFAGRLWYFGVEGEGYNTRCYFSQIIKDKRDAGKCYQSNDPTSEELFDLLDNDGGVINIPDMGIPHKAWVIDNFLLIFTDSGIWNITGSDGVGFKATDFSVNKLSSIEAISSTSFVDVDGSPYWWNYSGIYTVVRTNNLSLGVIEITSQTNPDQPNDGKIREYYKDIPFFSKLYARGFYNNESKIVQWAFNMEGDCKCRTDTILCYNTYTQAFYPWTYDRDSIPQIIDIVANESVQITRTTEEVVDSSGTVVTAGGETVYADVEIQSAVNASKNFKYITIIEDDPVFITLSEEADTGYLDWRTENPVDYESYFETIYYINDLMTDFQSNYVLVYFERQDDASCFMHGRFDFSVAESSNRFSTREQVYRHRTHFEVNYTKKKVRGNGKALKLRFESEEGKPFKLLAWAAYVSSNSIP